MACRISRSEEWALRLEHESHGKEGCFVTLTYSDNPESLSKSELQKFIKRLRERVDTKLKYYACGEYGDLNGRPHYHLILIGWMPKDLYKVSYRGMSSKLIEDLWKYGYNVVAPITGEDIRYVTGYVRKKLYGKRKEEYGDKMPPFALMSLGIGKEFVEKNEDKILKGYLMKKGKKIGVPRYYQKLLDSRYDDYKMMLQARGSVYREEQVQEYYNELESVSSDRNKKIHTLECLERSDMERRRKLMEGFEKNIKKGML